MSVCLAWLAGNNFPVTTCVVVYSCSVPDYRTEEDLTCDVYQASQQQGGASGLQCCDPLVQGKAVLRAGGGHKSRQEVKADFCMCLKTRSNPEATL